MHTIIHVNDIRQYHIAKNSLELEDGLILVLSIYDMEECALGNYDTEFPTNF